MALLRLIDKRDKLEATLIELNKEIDTMMELKKKEAREKELERQQKRAAEQDKRLREKALKKEQKSKDKKKTALLEALKNLDNGQPKEVNNVETPESSEHSLCNKLD